MKSVIKYPQEGSQLKDFTGLEGKWVLEVEGRIVASSDRPDQILDLAEEYHEKDMMVFMVPYPGRSFY